jgi:hypothetical protein
MTDEQRRALAPKFGLDPDTATEAEVIAAAIAAPDPATAEVTPPATTPEVPEGFSIVDDATLNELREGAGLAVAASRREQRTDRDSTISAAISAGKIPPGRREAFEAMWGDPAGDTPGARRGDPEGTRQLLASLAPGLVPVELREVGNAGDGEPTEGDGGGTGLFNFDDDAQEA